MDQLDYTATRGHDLAGPAFQMLSADVAYLKLSGARNADVSTYLTRASAAQVLVVDIRNYPSEYFPLTLGGRLVQQPTPFVRMTMPDLANPGAFVWSQPIMVSPIMSRFEGEVVILVDEATQSQGEYTAMALRASPHATIYGSPTAGANGNVTQIPLVGGIAAVITGIGMYHPDGRQTQRLGLAPDVIVVPTHAGILNGRDEVLDAAVSAALGRAFQHSPGNRE